MGGGSVVTVDQATKEVSVGPLSVAFELTTKAHVFGGNTLTLTDIAVAAGNYPDGSEIPGVIVLFRVGGHWR